MAGAVKTARLDVIGSRVRLEPGRQPHWVTLGQPGRHLGYQRAKGAAEGRWLLRRYVGPNKYAVTALGRADDKATANGQSILSFDQAMAKARAMVDEPGAATKVFRITVNQALDIYFAHIESLGQPVAENISKARVHIRPELGSWALADLTAARLRRWLDGVAKSPAQKRPKDGKPQYHEAPKTEEDKRKRRNTGNRILTLLKAALNHAFDEKHVNSRDEWGRRLKPLTDADAPRVRYFEMDECRRLLNAADADFRPLLRAALETGARYGELSRLEVGDFHADSGTLAIRKSKTHKARNITLTDEGVAFFKAHCAGKSKTARMFLKADGSPWLKSNQAEPMKEACTRGRVEPAGFHTTRHTWASHSVMAGMPLLLVARNLGHKDTRQVERTYGHLAPSYVTDMIKAHAPKYAVAADTKIVPLK